MGPIGRFAVHAAFCLFSALPSAAADLQLALAKAGDPPYPERDDGRREMRPEVPGSLTFDPDQAVPGVAEPAEDDAEEAPAGDSADDADGDAIAVLYDLSALPEPVARMRELIVEAAATGDVEALAPLIGIGPSQTRLAINGTDGDPIDYLRETSGDGEGQESLAIILDILDAGFVRQQEDGQDIYVWPYFFAMPLEDLSAPQKVELFRIITAGDYAEMSLYGGYNFYRIGITAEGEWAFFVAGD